MIGGQGSLWARAWQFVRSPKGAALVMEVCVVVALVMVVVAERGVVAYQRRIMPAGDVYNYQNIARHILEFDYPAQEKRLPGFPVLLAIATSVGFDATQAGIVISIISAAATTVVLYVLGRHFGFPIFPLAACLLLLAVSPIFALNGIRPLADSYFLFLMVLAVYVATAARPTRRLALAAGFILVLLIFTRYDGIPIAFFLLLCLRLRMPWKLVMWAALPPLVAGLLWLPVAKQVIGSFEEFGYVRDAGQNASFATLPVDYLRLVKSAGFGRAWAITDIWSGDETLEREAKQMPYQLGWWLSVLGSFGVAWMVFSLRTRAWPLLLTFLVYPVAPAWWFTYSRYVGPISVFYIFSVVAGAAGVWVLASRLLVKIPAVGRVAVTTGLAALLMAAVWQVVPVYYREAQGKSFDNNGRAYSLYLALQSLREGEERVVLSYDHLAAVMILGRVDEPRGALNAGRGMYLSDTGGASVEDMAQYIRERRAEMLVDYGESDMTALVAYLQKQGVIVQTETVEWPRKDGEIDRTHLHYLVWER